MIHGLVLVDKSKNITSHAVVDEIRKIFKIKKVGHFGTLDPLAEGLLLIALGNATKFFNYYIGKKKRYTGLIKFGCATTTYDSEGECVGEKKEINLYQIDIPALMSRFTGKLMQAPPIYSAKKFKGKPFYKYARENKEEEVEIKPAAVEVYSLIGEVVDKETLRFEASTSSGTYVRSLAHDMGQDVGVGAYLEDLRREEIGEFHVKDAFNLAEIARCAEVNELTKVVIPIEMLLPEFPKIIVNQGGRFGILNGQPLLPRDILKVFPTGNAKVTNFRLFDDEGKLLAIVQKEERVMRFKPLIVFSN
ncbi:MAG: tRNA pseudouridine(55) synthase TruB [Acidobacteria bacterium]|jgi:tRNA pseudouridine55 synthase|nr:tRNA pseudouridine(55) synthase TruB [Acidobacteriota bacterium]